MGGYLPASLQHTEISAMTRARLIPEASHAPLSWPMVGCVLKAPVKLRSRLVLPRFTQAKKYVLNGSLLFEVGMRSNGNAGNGISVKAVSGGWA